LKQFQRLTPGSAVEYRYAKISYEYDFNDSWVHNIEIIGLTKATDKFECTDGAGHGVAEKIGGWGPWKELKDNYRTLVPSEKQKEQRVWFENIAMNADPEGHFNGHETSGVRRIISRSILNIEESSS
jgi:hypothetical protein